MSGFMNLIKEKLSVNTDKIRNRADINQQYKDSEFREKNYGKKKGLAGETMASKARKLRSLTGD